MEKDVLRETGLEHGGVGGLEGGEIKSEDGLQKCALINVADFIFFDLFLIEMEVDEILDHEDEGLLALVLGDGVDHVSHDFLDFMFFQVLLDLELSFRQLILIFAHYI